MKYHYVLVLICLVSFSIQQTPSQQPVIGIYTQDAEDITATGNVDPYYTYIAASYVKNLEMAGAQVIPLFYHYSYAQLDNILGKINGVFFPGTYNLTQAVKCLSTGALTGLTKQHISSSMPKDKTKPAMSIPYGPPALVTKPSCISQVGRLTTPLYSPKFLDKTVSPVP